ncbi:MAG: c-type cytochrome [Reyranellales bacterium]
MNICTGTGVTAALLAMMTPAIAQSGDAAAGERVFDQQCKICHTVEKDGRSLVGPNLFGMFGRKAGTAGGFSASQAMTNSGIVWDDKTIGEYLRDPKSRVPGTKMVYAGLKRQEQLDDLIGYLKKATQ